ncbi:OmpA family protein [Neolewinella litorea]|uniref:OmpA family protein n=1 Tax=Neolewinella litorea TaxID=2562452 RepID=A0A4S4NL93_9BACT|nr:OmpA family protein [Neolewinella litorea]THH40666.1 OmpA family protein [Neolewinella litorea]
MYNYFLPLLLLMTGALAAQSDGTIFLTNPSFEDMPRVAAAPRGWTDCGFPGESAVDIQPDPMRLFKVDKPAQDGYTYLGMVTRDNDTYERISQRLSAPLKAGQCYEFNVRLARSERYLSKSRLTDNDENYDTPIKLRIRGGYDICDVGQVIGESPLVTSQTWREYRIKLKPEQDYTHIMLEAYYKTPILFPYNGNVLLDNVQPLAPVACDQDLWESPDAVTEAEPAAPAPARPSVTPPPTPRRTTTPPAPAKPAAPQVKLGQTRGELKIGQVFAIEDIKFKANSAEIEGESQEALEEIAKFLRDNTDVVVEIGGHASYRAGPVFAARLSEERAVAVIDYLNDLEIGPAQMLPRGYGKSRPVCLTDTPECNERNQRVEVKILKVRESR